MKGTKTVNLGVTAGYGLGVVGSVETGVTDDISAGLIASFSSRHYGYSLYNYRVTYIVVGARGSYHLGRILGESGVNVDKLDPYLGLTAGFRAVKYSDSYDNYGGAGTGIYVGGHGGIRYQVNEKLGVYAEGGYPLSSLGVTFKF